MTHMEALIKLQEGNRRFVAEASTFPRLDHDRRVEVREQGQNPVATILACSDSRVPVEHIFDQGMGDLFVLRVAGNVSGSTQIASVEFGVHELSTPLILVLGHDDCGAIKAAIDKVPTSGHLLRLLRLIHPTVEATRMEYPNATRDELIPRVVAQNVFQTIEGLLSGSDLIADALKDGRIRIVGAVFDIASGKVTWLGDHPDQRLLIKRRRGLRLRQRKDWREEESEFSE